MRKRFNQVPGRVVRHLSIGVQRDDEANALQLCIISGNRMQFIRMAFVLSLEKPIQLFQFAALSFTTNPAPFAVAPLPRAVEQEEMVAAIGLGIALIEFVYADACRIQ